MVWSNVSGSVSHSLLAMNLDGSVGVHFLRSVPIRFALAFYRADVWGLHLLDMREAEASTCPGGKRDVRK